ESADDQAPTYLGRLSGITGAIAGAHTPQELLQQINKSIPFAQNLESLTTDLERTLAGQVLAAIIPFANDAGSTAEPFTTWAAEAALQSVNLLLSVHQAVKSALVDIRDLLMPATPSSD